MEPFFDKLLIAFISAIFGITAAVLTPLFLEWRKRQRLKNDLVLELENLRSQIHLQHFGYMRSLQLLAHGVIDPGQALKFANPIYTHFYKDVCAELTPNQRQSFEMIHGKIEAFNQLVNKESDLTHQVLSGWTAEIFILALQIGTAQYENIRVLDWHIGHHLRNQENPELGYRTAAHREYLLKLEEIRQDINKIQVAAKKLDPKEFGKPYRSDDFKHLDRD